MSTIEQKLMTMKYEDHQIRDVDMLSAVQRFHQCVNPNYSSSTIYFGLDYILNGFIPQTILDNNYTKVKEWFVITGFKIRDE